MEEHKNLAPAGLAFVIVKEVLGKVTRHIPSMLNYKIHIDNGSMFNTPPVLPVYSALETLHWIKSIGGLKEMEKRNIRRLHFCTMKLTVTHCLQEQLSKRTVHV